MKPALTQVELDALKFEFDWPTSERTASHPRADQLTTYLVEAMFGVLDAFGCRAGDDEEESFLVAPAVIRALLDVTGASYRNPDHLRQTRKWLHQCVDNVLASERSTPRKEIAG